MTLSRTGALLSLLAFLATRPCPAEWKPAKGPLFTRWAKDVKPENALPEYPRPQLARKQWLNLNGLWSYAVQPRDQDRPESWAGDILVPFPIESALSGVRRRVAPQERVWYQRTFTLPGDWAGQKVLLHFGASDWETTALVNGTAVGTHRGGYDPFTFDITKALRKDGPQVLTVSAWDPIDLGTQPRGKQVQNPEGIWYTPTTGIWQTVWLEPVPTTAIESLRLTPDIDAGILKVRGDLLGEATGAVEVEAVALDGEREVGRVAGPAGRELSLPVPDAKLWSPDSPFLYGLKVSLRSGGSVVDTVTSYFGMRKTSVGKDAAGVTRLLLNNKFLFQFGPLDQGFWPDGLYTAPTDEALRYDIEATKKLGYNMARKHVKVEPARWYYWCDKLGLLVWQDMPSGDRAIPPGQPDIQRTPESTAIYETELKALLRAHHNAPSIVVWVPFNEGWGQFDTARIAALTRELDPSRVVNSVSGWNDREVGDLHDFHVYPGPGSPTPTERRAAVLGEFGGLGLPVSGHTWQDERNWGYRSFKTQADLTAAYEALVQNMLPLIGSPGLSAAVYTQTTDVEIEVNGLLTYDREIIKPDLERVRKVNGMVYLPPPKISQVTPTSERAPLSWQYTFEAPAAGWEKPGFDDSRWLKGDAGFGTDRTPGAFARTEWSSENLWIRRSFELEAGKLPANPRFVIHHDEDVEVYINGVLAAKLEGFTTGYEFVDLTAEGRAAFRPGKNTVAAHCKQTRGGQYLDLGIVNLTPATAEK